MPGRSGGLDHPLPSKALSRVAAPGLAAATLIVLAGCSHSSGHPAAVRSSKPIVSPPAAQAAASSSAATTQSTSAPTTTTVPPPPPPPALLGPGTSGPAVLALQQKLTSLGYWLGTPDGSFGNTTIQAVYAFQKAAGTGADGVVGPATSDALARGVVPHARSSSGSVIEVDLAHDLLLFVTNGKVAHALNTSTGGGY